MFAGGDAPSKGRTTSPMEIAPPAISLVGGRSKKEKNKRRRNQ